MKKPAPAKPQFHDIPAFARPTECRGSTCIENIYFVKSAKSGKTVPVSCDVEGTYPPQGKNSGVGIAHHQVCPDVGEFKKKK